MEVSVFNFSAKELLSVHPDHLGFILASSHCCNELTSVGPYIIFEQKHSEANSVERAFIQLRFYTLIRLQIGKIFEYRSLCDRYVGQIRKTFPATAEKIAKRWKEISGQINSASWAQTVRNKVAFHFDAKYAVNALKQLPGETNLKFIAGSMQGLTAFDFADRIIVDAMFVEAGGGDWSAGQETVKNWTIGLSSQISRFHAEIMKEVFRQYGLVKQPEKQEIRKEFCAERGSIFIPIAPLIPNSDKAVG